MDLNDIEK